MIRYHRLGTTPNRANLIDSWLPGLTPATDSSYESRGLTAEPMQANDCTKHHDAGTQCGIA